METTFNSPIKPSVRALWWHFHGSGKSSQHEPVLVSVKIDPKFLFPALTSSHTRICIFTAFSPIICFFTIVVTDDYFLIAFFLQMGTTIAFFLQMGTNMFLPTPPSMQLHPSLFMANTKIQINRVVRF